MQAKQESFPARRLGRNPHVRFRVYSSDRWMGYVFVPLTHYRLKNRLRTMSMTARSTALKLISDYPTSRSAATSFGLAIR